MERRRVLLFPAQSGRVSSRLIDVAFGLPSAVATLARLPGTAVLSVLLDQGVFGSQPMPAHFAAATSTDACAELRASASAVGSERVLLHVWCSYVFAKPA